MINDETTDLAFSENNTPRKQWITPELTTVSIAELTHSGTGSKSDGVTGPFSLS